jgi:alpha-glucosidase
VLARFQNKVGSGDDGGWPCWALSNHDVTRLATRWGGAKPDQRLLRLAPAFQMGLRGTVCLYQGEELGLPEADVAFEDLQDPYGITMWPQYKGRDGCRTPMPWNAEAHQAGFSNSARTWLPVAASHLPLAVSQHRHSASMLAHYTRLIAGRKKQPALVHGTLALLAAHPQVLAWVRTHPTQQVLCVYNFSDQAVHSPLPDGWSNAAALPDLPAEGCSLTPHALDLAPWGWAFLQR